MNMVYCVYSLESPHWGDSIVNTQHTFILKKIENLFRYASWPDAMINTFN